jgi:spore germination protein GerM
MIAPRMVAYGAVVLVAGLVGSALFLAPRYYDATETKAAAAPAAVAPEPGRKIKARLFYVNDEGTRLTSIERDVAYSDGAAEQAREILVAQIGPVTEPLVSAIPPGTTLRTVFVTEKGQAFVDLSREVVTAHPGGTLNELLTVYTVVNALTTNLPAVTSVQVLVDGKEVDTLAGHIDLRRPLAKSVAWVQ